jgi:O-antigen/teichoic acid export membrane protein
LKLKQIFQNEFAKNVLTLMTGTGFAQLIPLLAAPFIARLFTPDEIGVFAFYFSIVIIVGNLAAGRYEPAIAIAKTDKDAMNLVALSIILSFFVSLLAFSILFVLYWNYSLFDGAISENWAFGIPILIWVYSSYKSVSYLAIRKKKFKSISLSSIFESSFRAGTSILLGFLGFGSSGLILGGMFGKMSSLVVLLSSTHEYLRKIKSEVSISRVKVLARKFSKFPKYDLPATMFHTVGDQGTVILIVKLFGEKTAGLFSYTERVLITPISIFSSSFAQVFLQKISQKFHEDKNGFQDMVSTTFNRFVWYGIVPFMVFTYSSKFLVPIIFGPNWLELYKYIWILSPYIFLVMANAPLGEVLYIIGKQEKLLVLKVVFLILRFSALIVAYFMDCDPLMSIFLFSIASVIAYEINIIIVLRTLKNKRALTMLLLNLLIIGTFVILHNIL